jgi:hypothetical protein
MYMTYLVCQAPQAQSFYSLTAELSGTPQENTLDVTTMVTTMTRYAYERVQRGVPMPGVFEVARTVPVGLAIEDILLLAEGSLEQEMEDEQGPFLLYSKMDTLHG